MKLMFRSIRNRVLLALILLVLIGVSIVGYACHTVEPSQGATPRQSNAGNKTSPSNECQEAACSALESKYNQIAGKYALKYPTFATALDGFRAKSTVHMSVQRIDYYVPGKLPRQDGNPYFIGIGVVSQAESKCVVGYMNLVTGEVHSNDDVCTISD